MPDKLQVNLWEVLGHIESSTRDALPGEKLKAGLLKSALTKEAYWRGQEISIEADDGWVVRIFSCDGDGSVVLRVPRDDRGGGGPVILEIPSELFERGVIVKPTGHALSVNRQEVLYLDLDDEQRIQVRDASGTMMNERFDWNPATTESGFHAIRENLETLKENFAGMGHRVLVVDVDCGAPWLM